MTMRWCLPMGLAVAWAVGCDGDGSPGTDAGASDASNSSDAASMLLQPGTWGYAQYTITQDTCAGSVDGDGSFTVENIANGFRMVRSGNNPASTCTVDASKNFQCATPDQVRDMRPATDAVLTARLTLSGRITTTTLASGMQGVSVTCAGTDCTDLNPGACTVTATVALAKL